jgi:hypothetical protein
MARAIGVVAMGGYNTFCEILSFDKRAVIVPRTAPRMEQYIRAARAQELGLVSMLTDDDQHDPRVMATALRQLPQQKLPSQVIVPGCSTATATCPAWSTVCWPRTARPASAWPHGNRARSAATPKPLIDRPRACHRR